MEAADYYFIFSAYTIASFIKGLTGIGFSTCCLPIMALQLDLKVAIPLVIIPSIISNVAVMSQVKNFGPALKRFWTLYLASIPGIFVGLGLLVVIPANLAKATLGMVLLLYSLWAIGNLSVTLGSVWEPRLKVPVGFLNGFVNGLTGSQVMPILPFLLSLNLNKKLFVQAINLSFTISSLVLLLGMNNLALLSTQTFQLALAGLGPIFIAVFMAGKVQHRISGNLHRLIVLAFLLIMGSILIIRSAI